MKKENAPYGAPITRSAYIAAMFSRMRHRKAARLSFTLSLGLAGCASLDKSARSPAGKKLIAQASQICATRPKQSGTRWARANGCVERTADGSKRLDGERERSRSEASRLNAGAERSNAKVERPGHEAERLSAEVERPHREAERLSAEAERFNRSHSPFRRTRGQFHL